LQKISVCVFAKNKKEKTHSLVSLAAEQKKVM
jgi:hypothetical protein